LAGKIQNLQGFNHLPNSTIQPQTGKLRYRNILHPFQNTKPTHLPWLSLPTSRLVGPRIALGFLEQLLQGLLEEEKSLLA
jgi:hypothetical protein